MCTEDNARDLNSGQVMLGGKRILAATLVLAAAGCTGGNSTRVGQTPVRGGTAVYALSSGAVPDYIFPFLSSPALQHRQRRLLHSADVPAAVLVRLQRPAGAQPGAEPG